MSKELESEFGELIETEEMNDLNEPTRTKYVLPVARSANEVAKNEELKKYEDQFKQWRVSLKMVTNQRYQDGQLFLEFNAINKNGDEKFLNSYLLDKLIEDSNYLGKAHKFLKWRGYALDKPMLKYMIAYGMEKMKKFDYTETDGSESPELYSNTIEVREALDHWGNLQENVIQEADRLKKLSEGSFDPLKDLGLILDTPYYKRMFRGKAPIAFTKWTLMDSMIWGEDDDIPEPGNYKEKCNDPQLKACLEYWNRSKEILLKAQKGKHLGSRIIHLTPESMKRMYIVHCPLVYDYLKPEMENNYEE